jgi:DNA-dependent RNA polymerase auxiliary subunit epsilon
MEKRQLLDAVRKGINDTRNGEISQLRRIAKDPEFFVEKVNKISDEHLKTLERLDEWTDELFAERWDEYILDSGAGVFNFLSDMLSLHTEPQDKKEKAK